MVILRVLSLEVHSSLVSVLADSLAIERARGETAKLVVDSRKIDSLLLVFPLKEGFLS